MLRHWIAGLAWLGLTAGATVAGEPAGPVAPGWSRGAVIRALGRPDYERLERNGVRCLAYRTQNTTSRDPKPRLPRDGLVTALRDGKVVSTALSRFSEIPEQCSALAATYDKTAKHRQTCFRKFWLRCP